MIEIIQLSESNWKNFCRFTKIYKFNPKILVLIASINKVPCGILIAERDKENEKICNISNLFVPELLRREGIATCLLDEFLKRCKKEGYSEILFNSVTTKENIEILNLFLKNYDFEPVKTVANIYTFNDLDSILKNKLVKYSITSKLTPPPGIKILPLNEVDPSLIDNVVNKVNIDYPDHYALLPTDQDPPLKQINTFVAIANDNEIIGWLLGLDVPSGAIFYKTFYVKEEYRNLAIGFYLMCYCVKNHAAKYLYRPAICGLSLKNASANQFNSTFFKDVNKLIAYEFEARKFLNKSS